MKHRCTKTSVLIAAGLLASLTQAAATNITIPDFNRPGGPVNKPAWGFGGGPLGQAGEDNEVEYSAARNQYWDLEAFVVKGSTLYLVGGYDFQNGYSGGTWGAGDLFIKVGGSQPDHSPLVNPTTVSGKVYNGISDPSSGYNTPYNWTYAINLSSGFANPNNIAVSQLQSQDLLRTTQYDSLGSNPWKVFTTQWTGSTKIQYFPNQTAAQVASLTGVANLKGDSDGGSADVLLNDGVPTTPNSYYDGHNVVAIDLSFLTGADNVWFSYTMECGNDSLKGFATHIPDGGTTLVLLGTALSGLFLVGRRFSKQ